MSETAATAGKSKSRIDPKLREVLTEEEQTFLIELAKFLQAYPNWGGSTPYKNALAATFRVQVVVHDPRKKKHLDCNIICCDDINGCWCCG